MSPEVALIREQMRTPRAAAIAGIIFSLLMMDAQLLIRTSVSTVSLGPATNVVSHSNRISLALDLMPFAGIAFLWFIAVYETAWESLKTASLQPFFSVAVYSTSP